MVLRSYNESVIPGGVGPREEQCHPGAGLRVSTWSVTLRHLAQDVSGPAAAVGGVAGADVTDWTQIVWGTFNGRLSVPSTPVFNVANVPAANKQIRLWVRGFDQFGSAISEITPWVQLDAVGINTQFAISKVFSYVSRVDFKSIDIDSGTDIITCGVSNLFDPTFADDNPGVGIPIFIKHPENLGIGLPLRVSPYGRLEEDYEFSRMTAYNVTQSLAVADGDALAILDRYESGVTEGYTIGVSAPGFEGCENKVGVHRDDAWAAKFQTQSKPGVPATDFRFGGEAHVPPPSRASDTLKLHLYVRSRRGTRYNSHGAGVRMGAPATNSYPLG